MRKLILTMAVALMATAIALPGSAAARGCRLDIGSGAVKSNVSCHITSVVTEKATAKITRESQSFRVYARGWWHCETAPVAGYHAVLCTRHQGIISIATE